MAEIGQLSESRDWIFFPSDLVALAYHKDTRSARVLGYDIDRQYAALLKDGEMPGTIDVLGRLPDGRTVVVGGAGGLYSFTIRSGTGRPAPDICQIHVAAPPDDQEQEPVSVRVTRPHPTTADPKPTRIQLNLADDGTWADLYPDRLRGWQLARLNAVRLSVTISLVGAVLLGFQGLANYAHQQVPGKPKTDIHTVLIEQQWLRQHLF